MAKIKRNTTTTRRGSVSAVSSPVEFNPDYTNVKTDLKRIGMLAGSFFAILIILSFFLR